MGIADVIPGVSGGTIAFITGIYKKLIESLNNIDLSSVKYLFTGNWRKLEEQINISFLLTLVMGVFVAAFSLAKLIRFLLHTYEEAVWAFFFGLIAASTLIMFKHVRKWEVVNIAALIVAAGLGYWLTIVSVIQTPNTLPFIYLSGFIAIVAMILPGVSGSFILLILDKYRYIIDVMSEIATGVKDMLKALFQFDFNQLTTVWQQTEFLPFIIFQLGTLSGIIGFSKLLNWLLKKYHDLTIATLIGIMIGSLNKVWPWKNTLTTYVNRKGETLPLTQENVLPQNIDNYFFLSIALSIVGFAIVYYIERYFQEKAEV